MYQLGRNDSIFRPFDMTVLNEHDRFHLALSALDRLPHLGNAGTQLRMLLNERLRAHRRHICQYGEAMPEIRDWQWRAATPRDWNSQATEYIDLASQFRET